MSIAESNLKLLELKTTVTLFWFRAKKRNNINEMFLWDSIIAIINKKLIR